MGQAILAMNMPLPTVKQSGKATAKMGNSDGLIRERDDLPVFNGVTYEDHVAAFNQLKKQVDGRQWVMGEIVASVKINYGEKQLAKFAKEVGISPKRLMEYRKVHLAYEKSERSDNLPWSVHLRAASATDPVAVIREAEAQELSSRGVAKMVAGEEAAKIDLDDLIATGLSEHQRGLWEEYKRAARGIKANMPFLREAVENHIDQLEEMIENEIRATPAPLRVRILKIIVEGYVRLDDIVKQFVTRSADDPDKVRRLSRDVCAHLLLRLVDEGLLRLKHQPREQGARGAEAAIYGLTAAGEAEIAKAD